jgi:hypothetical protein
MEIPVLIGALFKDIDVLVAACSTEAAALAAVIAAGAAVWRATEKLAAGLQPGAAMPAEVSKKIGEAANAARRCRLVPPLRKGRKATPGRDYAAIVMLAVLELAPADAHPDLQPRPRPGARRGHQPT